MIVDGDLSQVEWRTAAFLSQDPIMMEEIGKGIDQHAAACTDLMELPLTKENRQDAKIFNFRAIYIDPDIATYAYWKDPTMPNFSKTKWEKVISAFFEKYAGLQRWHNEIYREVVQTGQLVGITGRVWKFDKTKGGTAYNKGQIFNYPVQGTAGDLLKLAIRDMKAKLKAEEMVTKFIMAVHDSLVFDAPKKELDKLAHMIYITFKELPLLFKQQFGIPWNVPLAGEVKAGTSWGNMEPINI